MGSRGKKKRKQKRLLAYREKDLWGRSIPVGQKFFLLIELRNKYDPNSREKIRNDPCVYCGSTEHRNRTVDHIRPKSKGGPNAQTNLASSCGECNMRKGNLELLHFLLTELNRAV